MFKFSGMRAIKVECHVKLLNVDNVYIFWLKDHHDETEKS